MLIRKCVQVVVVLMLVAVAAAPALCQQLTSASALGNKDGGKTETAIGSFVADAVRQVMHTEIAFVASSELKPRETPFPAGKVAADDISALVSYPDDPLAVLEIKGSAIRQALEKSVTIYPQPNLGFLQVSGMKFSFDPKKSSGSRVTSVTIGSAPLDESRFYTVAVTNSMANGALGYWKVWTQNDVKRRAPDTTVVKAITSYATSNPKIDYGTLDRITVTK